MWNTLFASLWTTHYSSLFMSLSHCHSACCCVRDGSPTELPCVHHNMIFDDWMENTNEISVLLISKHRGKRNRWCMTWECSWLSNHMETHHIQGTPVLVSIRCSSLRFWQVYSTKGADETSKSSWNSYIVITSSTPPPHTHTHNPPHTHAHT